MIDGLYADDPKEFEPFVSSFQWKLKLLSTNLKWWFILPALIFLFILPWILLMVSADIRQIVVVWAVLSLIIGYLAGIISFILYNVKQIKALKQEKH